MDFDFDPTVSKYTSQVVTAFQTAGTLLIALLLRLLTRGIPGRFLCYWSWGWVSLALALVSLNVSFVVIPHLSPDAVFWVKGAALAAYAVFEYAFGFYLWAGCRAYSRGTLLSGRDWVLFVLPAGFGLVAPAFFNDINSLFPFHAAIFGGFCLLAFLATLRTPTDARQALIGLRLTQVALVAITLLFWHYAIVMWWALRDVPNPSYAYLEFSALYDALVETLLAFGMVVLGTDSVRREMTETNRRLAETNYKLAQALEQLAVAARTDPLTGLLNRRALDAILADKSGAPLAGCVAVIDVNDLKRINDTQGHAAGDAAIQLVARALRGQFRINDPIFRMGGDEFMVVLEGGRATELAGRLAALDEQLRQQRLPGVPELVDVIVAWGMADFEVRDGIPDALARADAEMYASKSRRKSAVKT